MVVGAGELPKAAAAPSIIAIANPEPDGIVCPVYCSPSQYPKQKRNSNRSDALR